MSYHTTHEKPLGQKRIAWRSSLRGPHFAICLDGMISDVAVSGIGQAVHIKRRGSLRGRPLQIIGIYLAIDMTALDSMTNAPLIMSGQLYPACLSLGAVTSS